MLVSVIALCTAIAWILFVGEGKTSIPGGWAGLIIALSGITYLGALIRREGPLTKLLALYPLLSLAFALLLAGSYEESRFLIPIWIFLTGLAIDGILLKTSLVNFDKVFLTADSTRAKKEIDSLFEPALTGIAFGEITRVNSVLEKVSSLKLQHIPPPFSVLYVAEQLEMLFESALKERYSLFCNQVISTLVKFSLRILPFNRDLAALCLNSVEKLTIKTQEERESSIEEKSLCTLQEASKVYLGDKEAPAQLGSYIAALIEVIHTIEKNSYRLNKEQPIKQLIIPFAEIRETLQQEPYVSHPETPLAQSALDRAIDTFKTLEIVLHTMPPNREPNGPEQTEEALQTSSPHSQSGEES